MAVSLASHAVADEPPRSEDCLACHADQGLQRGAPRPGRPASVFVDAAPLEASAHARLECVQCHAGATAPHEERLPAVQCGGCHDKARATLRGGAHGGRPAQARAPAPTCAGCHGTHAVRPVSAMGPEACERCHRREVMVYRESVHGRSTREPGSEAATCRSCHGPAHALLAAKDRHAPTYHLNLPRTCAECHANEQLARRHGIPIGDVYKLYMDSIHGRALTRSGLLVAANCGDCHGTHEIRAKAEPASRVFRASVPKTCGTCHAGVLAAFQESAHGRAAAKGDPKAPVCTDCHSAHQIRRVEGAPWQLEVIRECGTCHQQSLETFRDTFHGKVATLGGTRAAKCADCHGAHDIQPAVDPRSTVSPGNLAGTCGRCHAGATAAFAQFRPHADPHDRARFPELYYPYTLMTGLLVGTFGFFGVHTLLWLPRSLVERLRRRRERAGGEPPP